MDWVFFATGLSILNVICLFGIYRKLNQIDEIILLQNVINTNLLEAVGANFQQILKFYRKENLDD